VVAQQPGEPVVTLDEIVHQRPHQMHPEHVAHPMRRHVGWHLDRFCVVAARPDTAIRVLAGDDRR